MLFRSAENQLRIIAFPAISCGAYGYPVARAAEVAIRAIRAALDDALEVETVILVANDQHVHQALSKALGAAG